MEFNQYLLVIWSVLSTSTVVNAPVNTCRNPFVRTTSQSSDFFGKHTSVEAVDGCTNQTHWSYCCSHTQTDPVLKEAWWQVDLSDKVVIEYIQIVYRDETALQPKRFGGYQIYQSNVTEWRNSYNCNTDTTSIQSMMDLAPLIWSCTGNTRYLTIYVDRRPPLAYNWYSTEAIPELCEVEVYGCPVGKYGDDTCDSSCDTTCVNSLCHPDSGQCTYCVVGYYKSGIVCQVCPQNCLNDVCDVESGVCEKCLDGYHGSQCSELCGNCRGVGCDKDTGYCTTGCTDGWTGNNCDNKVIIVGTKEACNAAAVGIGVGSGVVILALVIVIIVLVRRLSVRQGDSTNHTHMTDLSTSIHGQYLHKDQDCTYDEIATRTRDQSTTQIYSTDGNYEQLGHREINISHLYDSTNVHKKN